MSKLGESLMRTLSGPLRALIPNKPWVRVLLVLVPILLVLALLEPVLRLFESGLGFVTRVLAPLLDSPGGRLLLLNTVLLVAGVSTFALLRGRLRALRSGLLLLRHLEAFTHLFGDTPRRARARFRRVARSHATPPREFPEVVPHARLQLARIAIAAGDADRAIRQLTRIREQGLPKELRRSVAHLRGRAFAMQGDVHSETLAAEILEAITVLGADAQLCELAHDLALARGDHREAIAMQEQVVALTTPRRRPRATRQLLLDLIRAGDAALAEGDGEVAAALARRAQKLDPDSAAPAVLLGRIRLADGDVRAAIREWGRSRSPAGLGEIARLLDERPGIASPRELLEACPLQGTVLLVAREYARVGDTVRAERAARVVARELGASPSAAAVLAEIRELNGRGDEARQITEEAVRRLVAPDPRGG